jgi:uncharacterized paraquat-inducible protein A
MLDVYLLGAVVAYNRLKQLADVVIGVGGYALAAFVFVQVLLEQSIGRQRIWRAIGDSAQYAPKPGEPWILCLDCEFVTVAPSTGSDGRRRRPRCGSRLLPRRSGSFATTAAFTLAGYILYLPANVLPVLTITRFGRTEPYTILGGVRDLAAAGLLPLALLVLFASILVPVLKLAGLSDALPHCAPAAQLPPFAMPGLGGHCQGVTGHRVKAPGELAGFGIIGGDIAAHSVFAAAGADYHPAFDHARRLSKRVRLAGVDC